MNDWNQSLIREVVATIDTFLAGGADIEQVQLELSVNEHLLERDVREVDTEMREAEADLVHDPADRGRGRTARRRHPAAAAASCPARAPDVGDSSSLDGESGGGR